MSSPEQNYFFRFAMRYPVYCLVYFSLKYTWVKNVVLYHKLNFFFKLPHVVLYHKLNFLVKLPQMCMFRIALEVAHSNDFNNNLYTMISGDLKSNGQLQIRIPKGFNSLASYLITRRKSSSVNETFCWVLTTEYRLNNQQVPSKEI